MEEIPDEVDDLRYAVLDNSDHRDPDYFFIPLIFLESFSAPAIVLEIAGRKIKMPIDWQILIGEKDLGDLEVVPLTSVNDRGFSAFCFNPMNSFRPSFHQVEVVDVYQEVKWYFPKLKPGHILCVPLEEKPDPLCAYFVKDINKSSEVVNYALAW